MDSSDPSNQSLIHPTTAAGSCSLPAAGGKVRGQDLLLTHRRPQRGDASNHRRTGETPEGGGEEEEEETGLDERRDEED